MVGPVGVGVSDVVVTEERAVVRIDVVSDERTVELLRTVVEGEAEEGTLFPPTVPFLI